MHAAHASDWTAGARRVGPAEVAQRAGEGGESSHSAGDHGSRQQRKCRRRYDPVVGGPRRRGAGHERTRVKTCIPTALDSIGGIDQIRTYPVGLNCSIEK